MILDYCQTYLRVGVYIELLCVHSSIVHPRPCHITANHGYSTLTATQTKCNVVVSLHITISHYQCNITHLQSTTLTKTHPQSSITISSCSLSTTQLMVISLFSCLQLTSSVVSDETFIYTEWVIIIIGHYKYTHCRAQVVRVW